MIVKLQRIANNSDNLCGGLLFSDKGYSTQALAGGTTGPTDAHSASNCLSVAFYGYATGDEGDQGTEDVYRYVRCTASKAV